MRIQNKLRKELKIIKENKLKFEKKLIKLHNDTDFNNYEDILIFRSDLIKELRLLEHDGLLNEENLDSISTNIANILYSIGKSAWDTMFIGIYKGIAKDLGFNPDSLLFRMVVEGFQSMTWGEITKVLAGDCRIATVKLVESIIKGYVSYIGKKTLPGGAGYDIIRRALLDQIFESESIKSGLEDAMAPYVCDYLKRWISNAEDKGATLKNKKQNSENKPNVLGSAKKVIGLT